MRDTTKWRTLHLWDFKTFLENHPRRGPLQSVLDGIEAKVENPRDYLLSLFHRGAINDDLMTQFREWMSVQQ